jgi:mono/diheme cytochrome c family protein
MKKFIPVLVLFLIGSACGSKKAIPKPFTKEMLANQLFSVSSGKDTLLETVHGSLIRITAGSFTVTGNVQVEIKEAFSPVEILAAGMTTESNGKPLRSGGMIYINASANGKVVELIKPIKISMPNTYYDSQMKVFKGMETDSGRINWVDPVATDTTPQEKNWITGKALFQSLCASCHRIFSDRTGPALADVEYRGPWQDRKNIYEYIKNPPLFMAKNRYTQNLKSKYGSIMTGFPISTVQTDAILDYIKNETGRPGALEDEQKYDDSVSTSQPINLKDTGLNMPDSFLAEGITNRCKDDTVYIPVPKQEQSFFEEDISNKSRPVDTIIPKVKDNILPGIQDRTIEFTDANPTNGMYDFEIKTFGWYNIDAFMEGYTGTTNVKIWAQVQIEFEIEMHVYLFCPGKQILSVGYEKQGDKYFFNKINGGIPLFLNDRAILFAFGSKDDKMFYGISEFRIQGEQTISVKASETTESEIRNALLSKQMNGIDLGIEKKEQKIIKSNCDDLMSKKDTTAKAK